MAKQRGGESKTGLVFTLVFFILATIGLGVSTYMGFDGQEVLRKQGEEAKGKLTTMTTERDWYKFQAHLYRAYLGQLPAGDEMTKMGLDKEKLDQKQLGAGQKDVDQVAGLKTFVDNKLGWDAAGKKPKKTYEDLLKEARDQSEELVKNTNELKRGKEMAEKRANDLGNQLAEAQKNFETELAKLNKKSGDDRTTDRNEIDKLMKEVARLGQEKAGEATTAAEERKKMEAASRAKDTTIKGLREQVDQKTQELGLLKQKGGDAPRNWRTDWKVVAIDRRGTGVYINLGSADQVQPQQTFTIHAVGPDGRPVPASKGTLEVTNVVEGHLSQARVTSVKDPNRDPVLTGDVLYNPIWSPTLKKHVAVTGVIDLTGDGRDSSAEFIRNLERQNVVVDAYLDLKDFQVKGKGITVQTDYLIVGEIPDVGEYRDKVTAAKLIKGVEQMTKNAQEHSVAVIALRKYLEMTGYRLPSGPSERPPASIYRPGYNPRGR
jgi:hypothetical protein